MNTPGFENPVTKYVKAKQTHIVCMQKHFREVCHRCKEYIGCKVCEEYIDTWMKLQRYSKTDLNKSLDELEKILRDLRVYVGYLFFDIEATRREKDKLMKKLKRYEDEN